MAASLVLEALSGLHSRKELQVQTPRASLVLKYGDEILAAVGRDENAGKFAKFAVHLLGEFIYWLLAR